MSDQRPADPVPAVRSLETLYRQEYAAVVALAHVLSGSRSTAEELAQEAFMAAHRRWGAISQYDDPGAWVRRVCADRSTSLTRRRASEAKVHLHRARKALATDLHWESTGGKEEE